jgi:competence ComEA-like helix-hairpin-helix protein
MLNLTKQERQVILFLITVVLCGIGLEVLSKRYASVRHIVCLNQDIGKVELNKADKETLIGVPGIGEKLAQRILDYRKEKTRFTSIEELKDVKGINEYRYEKIKASLCVK